MQDSDVKSLRIVPTASALASAAADIVADVLAAKPSAVLALPTGSTPLGMFTELARRRRSGVIHLSQARFFCLDEYLGLTLADPNSLTGWLFREFFEPAGINAAQVHMVPSDAIEPIAEANAYESTLAAYGGLDLAVLGIGTNGHIAFNEPGSAADSRTRVVELSPDSRAQAANYWEGLVATPTHAMTIGIGTILDAKRIVLIASGPAKSEILCRSLRGPVSADVPASLLRLQPEKLTVIADNEAASLL